MPSPSASLSASLIRRAGILCAICFSCTAVIWSSARAQTSEPATAPTTAPTSAPVVPADPSTPRGALKSLVGAMQSGDGAKIKTLIATTNPTEDRMVAAMVTMSESEKKFRNAAETAFGANAKDLTGDTEAGMAEGMAKIDGFKESIDGNSAIVDGGSADESHPLKLVKIGNAWQIPISELARGVNPATIDKQLENLAFRSKMMDESADEVAKGVYKTPKEAGEAIANKMMVAMMKRAAASSQPTTGPASVPNDEPPAPAPTPAPNNGM